MTITPDLGRIVGIAAAVASPLLPLTARAQAPHLVAPPDAAVTLGVAPRLGIAGLAAGDTATIVAWRRATRYAGPDRTDTLTVRSFAVLAGSPTGAIAIGDARPVAGTWSAPDPLGLFWSMERRDTALTLTPGEVALRLEWHGHAVDSLLLHFRDAAPGVRTMWVEGDGFAGAFARPAGAGPFPALLVLHGSEGGDSSRAVAAAQSFANHGFATFAVTYFSWGGRIRGVPTALVNIPVEMLDKVRAWLGGQTGVDTARAGIWGASKGAEFALVAAARRAWPRAVVACAASDVVWAGFGRPARQGERMSSWSDGGRPLDYVPYDNFQDVTQGRITSRTEHDRSRARFSDSVPPARIPTAQVHARLLLIGSDRDEVWPSGPMVRSMAAELASEGRAGRVLTRVDPAAGHTTCGTGMAPAAVYEQKLPTDLVPDPRATAKAAGENWMAAIDFLRRQLDQPRE